MIDIKKNLKLLRRQTIRAYKGEKTNCYLYVYNKEQGITHLSIDTAMSGMQNAINEIGVVVIYGDRLTYGHVVAEDIVEAKQMVLSHYEEEK